MKAEELKAHIEQGVPGAQIRLVRDTLLLENPEKLPEVGRFLKDSPELRLDYLASVTGADYLDYLESVYHFYSMEKKIGPVVLRVRTDKKIARLPSLVPVYRGAEYQEREAYDMYGIVYDGHPDLRRIFMWEGFEGFPMRKDYEQEDSEVLEMEDVEWLEARGVNVPADVRSAAEALKKQGKRAVANREGKEAN